MNTKQTPRYVTEDDVEKSIQSAYFVTGEEAIEAVYFLSGTARRDLKLLTLCIVTLNNGFTIVGKSACADPANYDAGVGRAMALRDAKNQIYPYLGFLVKQDMYEDQLMEEAVMAIADALGADRV